MLRASPAPLFALLTAAALLAGCANQDIDRTAGWSTEKIASEARDELSSGGYDKAVPLLEKLEGRAAGTPQAQQAQLDKAYALYKGREKAQALATLDRFMKLHPSSPAMDYALYFRGIINFNDDLGLFSWLSDQDLSERDQQAARESYESFKAVVTQFPNSRYAQDSREHMTYIVNSLAQYEVHVARYYYKRGAYVAAIGRAQKAISDYEAVPAAEEALYILSKSYDALGMTQLRDDASRVLATNYPDSTYPSKGFGKKDEPWWKVW